MRRLAGPALLSMILVAPPALAAEGTTLGIPDGIWKLLNLVAFLAALGWFIGRPLTRFLEDRRAGIRTELEAAREKLARAETLQAEVEQRLASVEREIEAIRERAEREGRAEAERILAEAAAEEERFLKRVEDEIARRTTETRLTLARDTADLTAQMARELLEREVNDADRKRILERSLAALKNLDGKD